MSRFGRAAGALALVASACVVDVNFGDGPYLCRDEPKTCAEGYECINDVCVRNDRSLDAGPTDAAVDAGAPMIPAFGTPRIVTELSDPAAVEDDASFSADLLVAVFNSNRDGTSSIWTSQRDSVDEPWEAPVLDSVLSTINTETTIAISPDGLTVFFASDRAGGLGGFDIYRSTRVDRADAWSAPENVASLNTAEDDFASWIDNDARSVIVHRRVDGEFALLTAELDSGSGTYTATTPISEVNTTNGELSGRFAANRLVITFHSSRPDGLGRADLYAATRASASDPFGPAVLIDDLSTAELDEDVWLSDDLCTIFYASVTPAGNRELFEASCEN